LAIKQQLKRPESHTKKRNSKSKKRRSQSPKKSNRNVEKDGLRKASESRRSRKDKETEQSITLNKPPGTLAVVEREVKTPKTADGAYFVLEPTLSQDHGPNHKEKIYNDIRLNYKKDSTKNRVFNFAEAKCIINIPHVERIENKKRRKKRAYETSKMEGSSTKKSPSRLESPTRGRSPRKQDRKSPMHI